MVDSSDAVSKSYVVEFCEKQGSKKDVIKDVSPDPKHKLFSLKVGQRLIGTTSNIPSEIFRDPVNNSI